MSKKPENPPAFPFEGGANNGIQPSEGMSLRDYFAAAALRGLLANPRVFQYEPEDIEDENVNSSDHPFIITSVAYKYADEMLDTREKPND